jgi:hypothetical protein
MTDQIINEEGTPPSAEEQARMAAVEARREADRLRKRAQRQRDREARQADEVAERIREARTEQAAQSEQATAQREQERRARNANIVAELADPIQPDTVDEDGNSYWATCVQPEVESFIDEHQRASGGSWEHYLFELSSSQAGRAVLRFYGVEPLDIPLGGFVHSGHKFFWTLQQRPSGPPLPAFVNLTPEERTAISALHEVWLANREAKKDWRP